MTNPVIVFAQFITTEVLSYIRTAKRRENANILRGKLANQSLSPSVAHFVTKVIEVVYSISILIQFYCLNSQNSRKMIRIVTIIVIIVINIVSMDVRVVMIVTRRVGIATIIVKLQAKS